jgi:hypothetical protein
MTTDALIGSVPSSGFPSPLPNINPRISVKEFARYNFASPRVRNSILRRQKFKKGEGIFRMKYYQPAIAAIRDYIMKGSDAKVIQDAVSMLAAELPLKNGLQRYKTEYNIQAIRQYFALYGKRKFEILPTPKLNFVKGLVTIGTQPDLCVREDGTMLLIKFDFCKTPEDKRFIPLMLQLIRDAARVKGLKIKARNIIVFDIVERTEHPCPSSRAGLKHLVTKLCREIEGKWDSIDPTPSQGAGHSN